MSLGVSLGLHDCLVPDWPAPTGVRALITTRAGGVSSGSLTGLNLGRSVGDEPAAVDENRRRVRQLIGAAPRWMSQVHGVDVARLDDLPEETPLAADAAVSTTSGTVCTVMMADCLNVLFCNTSGTAVAAAHAGWRGLADGVLEATVAAMRTAPQEILAYMGPAIGSGAFEVGNDLRDIFLSKALPAEREAVEAAFVARPDLASSKWLADIYALATVRLSRAGIGAQRVFGGGLCTYADSARFFSYRRSSHAGEKSGRMAAMIWLE